MASCYMGLYGGGSAKPHRLWSNDSQLLERIVKGKDYLARGDLKQMCSKPLVKKYVDKRGVARHSGIRGTLKASQRLGKFMRDLNAQGLHSCFWGKSGWCLCGVQTGRKVTH